MKKHFRLLIVLLILCVLFSFGYMAMESVHDCHGEEDCPVCKIIAVLPSLWGAVCLLFLFAECFRFEKKEVFAKREEAAAVVTPIALRVKLLN